MKSKKEERTTTILHSAHGDITFFFTLHDRNLCYKVINL